MALRTVLTTCLLSSFFLVNFAHASDALIEFKLLNFSGADSYPEYELAASEGAVTSKASLRCVENGYDGAVTWRYNEVMVFDETGPLVKRKEPRANVATEHGYRYQFKNFEECEKAAPQVVDGTAVCTMKLKLNRAAGTARFVSSECKRPSGQ